MKRHIFCGKVNGITLLLVIGLVIILIFWIANMGKPIEETNNIHSAFIIGFAIIVAIAILRLKKPLKRIKITVLEDSYHPTNYSAHSEFMNNDYLK